MVLTLEALLGERLIAGSEFVDDAFIAPGHPVAEQLPAPVTQSLAVSIAQPVNIRGEPAEVRCADQYIIGIDYPDVVAVPLGERQ